MNNFTEQVKEEILDYLRIQANASRYWFTINQIAISIERGHMTVKKVIFEMAVEGWLQIRNNDADNELFLIALNKNLRDVRYTGMGNGDDGNENKSPEQG